MTDIDRDELVGRLDDETLTILDVRSEEEYAGELGARCDPRQGRIAGALHLDLQELMELTAAEIEERLGAPAGAEVVTYCHSGSRSALAVQILSAAGYDARNYVGSWHEWSRDDSLPSESGR
ncbi:MAG TPA: rhodanese-like domain-containing protein [Gaiellaceae bacterium]|nr:rhodanese-like domain-containing protein [Gaiellaceae bacterium]